MIETDRCDRCVIGPSLAASVDSDEEASVVPETGSPLEPEDASLVDSEDEVPESVLLLEGPASPLVDVSAGTGSLEVLVREASADDSSELEPVAAVSPDDVLVVSTSAAASTHPKVTTVTRAARRIARCHGRREAQP